MPNKITGSVSPSRGDSVLDVFLLGAMNHILLVLACIEEGLSGVLAERVVGVHVLLHVLHERCLNIPEDVLGDGVEDAIGGSAL